jgi:hypothetical protein
MKRNSPNDFSSLDDLSELSEKLVDKRQDKRAQAKKLRRNRHYEKQFLKLAKHLDDHVIPRSLPHQIDDLTRNP